MTNLKNNIDHYMARKGIRFYSDLLIDVAHQLGIKGKEAYIFADREKANFSKMLKGERPLKYEFIIPLEKIFGVPLAKMMDEDAYKIPIDKNEVPIVKGYRYYAYIDDYDLYNKELDLFLTKEGRSSLSDTDEFGKTFLDYVVEYGSKNAVRFLRDKYGIKMQFYNNHFESSLQGGFMMFTHNGIEFARLVASIGDVQLFNDIYDPYYLLASTGAFPPNTIWVEEDFQELVLDNKPILDSLFERKTYNYKLGRKLSKEWGMEYYTFSSINPIINKCLQFSLKHLPKYREQAIEILKFGIKHNQRVIDGLTFNKDHAMVDPMGGVINRTDDRYEIIDVVITVSEEQTIDKEINDLISELPSFYNPYK